MKNLNKETVTSLFKLPITSYTSIIFNLNNKLLKGSTKIKNKNLKNIKTFITFVESICKISKHHNSSKVLEESIIFIKFVDNSNEYIISIRSTHLTFNDEVEIAETTIPNTILTVYTISGIYINHFTINTYEDFIAYLSIIKFYAYSKQPINNINKDVKN